MSVVTPFLGKKILDFVAGGATPERPGGVWMALFDGNEIALAAYSRRSATFQPADGGTCSLAVPVTFAMTSLTPFVVRTIGLFDQSADGNLLMTAPCSVGVQQDGAGFVVGQLAITLM
jgi:hypothetical protein